MAKYPEFDETPGLYPKNEGIYCRSYCPRHPKIHDVLFSLFDELIEAFEAKTFHAGMDEVFLLPPPTAAHFAIKGLNVISCPWRDAQVAIAQLDWMKLGQAPTNKNLASRFKGILQTTWCSPKAFIGAYYNRLTEAEMKSEAFASARESANSFKLLLAAIQSPASDQSKK